MPLIMQVKGAALLVASAFTAPPIIDASNPFHQFMLALDDDGQSARTGAAAGAPQSRTAHQQRQAYGPKQSAAATATKTYVKPEPEAEPQHRTGARTSGPAAATQQGPAQGQTQGQVAGHAAQAQTQAQAGGTGSRRDAADQTGSLHPAISSFWCAGHLCGDLQAAVVWVVL